MFGRERPTSRQERREAERRAQKERRHESYDRREFFRRAGKRLATAGLMVGGLAVVGQRRGWFEGTEPKSVPSSEVSPPDAETLVAIYRDHEQRLERAHGDVLQVMERLKGRVEANLHQLPETARQPALEPFQFLTFNESNPHRNHYRFLREELEKRGASVINQAVPMTVSDSRYFFLRLNVGAETEKTVANYSPLERALAISEAIEPDSLIDSLVIYHELIHLVQDTQLRASLQSETQANRYFGFWESDSPTEHRVNMAMEADAYIKELIILNLITGGRLAADASRSIIDEGWYARELGAHSALDRRTLTGLLNMGEILFADGQMTPETEQALVQHLTVFFRSQGSSVSYWQSVEDIPEQYWPKAAQ